jgi:hypothetical protein
MTFADFDSLVRRETDWWVKSAILRYLDPLKFGMPTFEAMLNKELRQAEPEPARCAAGMLFQTGGKISRPYVDIHVAGRLMLRTLNLIPSAGRPPTRINHILAYVLRTPPTSFDCRKFFASNHDDAERMAIAVKQRFETDIDAFVVSLDSLCDAIVRQLYRINSSTMTANYGSVLKGAAPAWLRAFPQLLDGFGKLHSLRINSFTAHPHNQKTGRPNRRIKHYHFGRIRKAVLAALSEIERNVKL